MENTIIRLEYLISLKKTKKEANKLERDEFANAWACLVESEGFSNRAEEFLYNGFTYCGAKPLKEYMKKQESPIEILETFFSGNLFEENCASTIKILIHLLALFINDMQKDYKIMASIIKRIPHAIKNKEGKIYGNADRTIKKYFLDEIKPDVEFPEIRLLIENGLGYVDAELFIKQLISIIDTMDITKYSNKCKRNIEKIRIWGNASKQEEVEDLSESDHNVLVSEKSQTDLSESIIEKLEEEQNSDVNSEKIEQILDVNSEKIEQISKELEETLKKVETLEKQIELMNKNNTALSKKLWTVEAELGDARKSSVEDNILINALKEKCLNVEEQLNEALNINNLQKNEIEQRSELIEMLRRDRLKQEDEVQKRLASKLRSYYVDYLDAESIEMSSELGENMRDQIGEIFKILFDEGFVIR